MAELDGKLKKRRIKELQKEVIRLGFAHSQTKDKAEKAKIRAKGEALVEQIRQLRKKS